MLGLGLGVGKITKNLILDSDVKAFVDANSITNNQEIQALNAAVISLKGSNSESYDFWSDTNYANFISPTSLAVSKKAIKFIGGEPDTAVNIGTDATHSADGVLFNGTTQGWNLGDTTGNIVRENLFVSLAFSNSATINGRSFGKNIDDGDPAPGDWHRTQCYRQNNSGNMGFLFGNTTGLIDRIGVWTFGNDGTNHSIWKDGVKLALTVTPIDTGELTGTEDDFLACRNGNGSGVPGEDGFQDDQVTTVLTFETATPYNLAKQEVLAEIVNTYNTNVA